MTGLLPILLAAWMGVSDSHDQENPLYRQLVATGVSVGGKSLAILPKPTMPDGASAADEQAALKSIPMRVPLDQFTRDSLVAPFAMVIGPLTETESGVRSAPWTSGSSSTAASKPSRRTASCWRASAPSGGQSSRADQGTTGGAAHRDAAGRG